MIRITKQTDYGIVLLTHMAAHADRQYNAPDLAAEAHLPLPMASKILKLLAREGVLVSHRGVKGGYSLGRHPQSISMADAGPGCSPPSPRDATPARPRAPAASGSCSPSVTAGAPPPPGRARCTGGRHEPPCGSEGRSRSR